MKSNVLLLNFLAEVRISREKYEAKILCTQPHESHHLMVDVIKHKFWDCEKGNQEREREHLYSIPPYYYILDV